jgi:ABC-type branched-subunit amino acid transport system substrate-binding protein
VAAINAAGGVSGHVLKITSCNTNRDPSTAESCARGAVANSNVVATVGSETIFGTNVMPVLQASGLPAIGDDMDTPADYKSPIAFGNTPGSLEVIGRAILLAQLGSKRLSVPYEAVAAGAAILPIISGGIKSTGAIVAGSPPVPLTAVDLSSQVAAIRGEHVDGIVPILATSQVTSLLTAMTQVGFTNVPFGAGAENENPINLAQQFPKVPLVFASSFNYQSAGWQHFVSDMAKYGQGVPAWEGPASGWLAVQVFYWAATHSGAVTRSDLLKTMQSATNVDTQGMTQPLNFTKKNTALRGSIPNMVNDQFYGYKVVNGNMVSVNNYQPYSLFPS